MLCLSVFIFIVINIPKAFLKTLKIAECRWCLLFYKLNIVNIWISVLFFPFYFSHGRFKRSNSVTAAVQADLELEGFPGHITMEDKGLQFGGSFQRHSEPSTPTQYGAVRTVRTQGLFSYREDYRTQVDNSNLPPPEPWLEPSIETVETGRMSPCRRDGSWFMKLLHTETKRMEGWCKEMEREAEENDLSEESKNISNSFCAYFYL